MIDPDLSQGDRVSKIEQDLPVLAPVLLPVGPAAAYRCASHSLRKIWVEQRERIEGPGSNPPYDPAAQEKGSRSIPRAPDMNEKESFQPIEFASISLLISAYTFRAFGRRGFRARTKA